MRALAVVFAVVGLMVGPGAGSAAATTWSVDPATVTEGGSYTVTITRELMDPLTFSVNVYAGAPGTATAGQDFTPPPSTPIAFGALDNQAVVTINTLQDTIDEADETLTVAVARNGVPLGSITRTIIDDDAEPTLAVGDASMVEGTGAAPTVLSFPVTLSAASGRAVTADISTADGTAVAGQDYVARTGTVSIPAGQTQGTFTVDVVADDLTEPNESFTVTLANPTGATLSGTGSAIGTITNDDSPPTLSITGPAPQPEGSDGLTTPFAFTIALSRAMSTSLQVAYATNDGSATAPADYAPTELTVTFAPGETQKVVTIPIVADRALEPNENFSVTLSDTGGLIATVGEATAIIVDDDTPVVVPPPPPPPPPAADITAPRVTLSKITSSRGVMRVMVTCAVGESVCRGTMTIFSVPSRKSKVKALRREVKLASSLFVLKGGERARLTLRPSKRAAGYIRQARTVRARGYAVARDAAGNVATVRTTGTVKAAR